MKQDDLAAFAVSDSLLARIAAEPAGRLTDAERHYLLTQARRNLARGADLTLEEAERLTADFTPENQLTIQAGAEFAAVSGWGRLLFVVTRQALRGACHPERN